MQELRLLGVHQDEEHVLLVAANGTKYRLPIDAALRAALRRVPARPDHTPLPEVSMRPREIQAMIRAGATAESIAETADIPLEHVQRYEGPVLAERAYVCDMAKRQQVRVSPGQPAPHLGDLVVQRLITRESPDEGTWDAWRLDDGSWIVQLSFRAAKKERTAQWSFQPQRAHLEPLDDEARWFADPGSEEAAFPHATSAGTRGLTTEPIMEPAASAFRSGNPPVAPSEDPTGDLLDRLDSQRGVRPSSVDPAALPGRHGEPDTLEEDLPPSAHPAASVVDERAERPVGVPHETADAVVEGTRDEASSGLRVVASDQPLDIDVTDDALAAREGAAVEGARDGEGGRGEVRAPRLSVPTNRNQAAPTRGAETRSESEELDAPFIDSVATAGAPAVTAAVSQRRASHDASAHDAQVPASRQPSDRVDDDVSEQEPEEPSAAGAKSSGSAKSSSRRPRVPSWDEIMFGARRD